MKLALKLSPWKKNAAIVAAAVTVVAGVVAGREKPSMEVIHERSKPVQDDGIDLARLRRPEAAEAGATVPQSDPFARNFGAPKPAQAAAVAEKPAAPVAPPLPFRYFGRLTENGKTEVFVMRGEDLVTLVPGQTIGDYRVEQVADAAISFTYLPMKIRQTLDLQ